MTFKLQLWSYDNVDSGIHDILLKMFNINSPPQRVNSVLGNEYKVKSGGQSISTLTQSY